MCQAWLAHKASKKNAAVVVRDGVSAAQLEYVRKQIGSVAAEGGKPVLVLDGRPYPPKLETRADRREKQAAAKLLAVVWASGPDGVRDDDRASLKGCGAKPGSTHMNCILHGT